MGPRRIVFTPELLDDDLGFRAVPEPLQGEALVPELAVEGLVGAVLPGLAGIDERRVDVRLGEPAQDRPGDELRAVAERRCFGVPWTLTSLARTSITRPERMPRA